ncbi:MAG: bifunctional phosphoglucose/phosphomannose isomerase, partial [Ardenticatenaceae bacterium]
MNNILNDVVGMKALDPDDMLARIREFPQQVRDAWENVSRWEVRNRSDRKIGGILVLGMGGSAIGADLVAGLLVDTLPIPMLVQRGYGVPAWVDEDTLVIASSYSGGTEETLSGWAAAGAHHAQRIAVTTGGKLAALALAADEALLTFSYESQPRAALGHSFTLTLGLLWRLGLIYDPSDKVKAAVELLEAAQREWQPEVPIEECRPKQIATWWHGQLPVIFGAEHLAIIARRWTTQINENSKSWALWAEMPELNHNVIVGFEHPTLMQQGARVTGLRSKQYHDRNAARFDITGELLDQADVAWATVEAAGDDRLGELLWTNLLGDYASYYLALLHGADPTPVEPIRYLK